MDPVVVNLISTCEHLLDINDAETSWVLINGYLQKVYDNQEPNSQERLAIAEVYKKMMIKWH